MTFSIKNSVSIFKMCFSYTQGEILSHTVHTLTASKITVGSFPAALEKHQDPVIKCKRPSLLFSEQDGFLQAHSKISLRHNIENFIKSVHLTAHHVCTGSAFIISDCVSSLLGNKQQRCGKHNGPCSGFESPAPATCQLGSPGPVNILGLPNNWFLYL